MYWGTSRWSAMEIMVNAHQLVQSLNIWHKCIAYHDILLTVCLASGGILCGTPVQPDTTCV